MTFGGEVDCSPESHFLKEADDDSAGGGEQRPRESEEEEHEGKEEATAHSPDSTFRVSQVSSGKKKRKNIGSK